MIFVQADYLLRLKLAFIGVLILYLRYNRVVAFIIYLLTNPKQERSRELDQGGIDGSNFLWTSKSAINFIRFPMFFESSFGKILFLIVLYLIGLGPYCFRIDG